MEPYTAQEVIFGLTILSIIFLSSTVIPIALLTIFQWMCLRIVAAFKTGYWEDAVGTSLGALAAMVPAAMLASMAVPGAQVIIEVFGVDDYVGWVAGWNLIACAGLYGLWIPDRGESLRKFAREF